MMTSFSEFKFFQSFRIPVEEADDLRFLVEQENKNGNILYINDAKLVDISHSGLGFSTQDMLAVGTEVTISLQFKKMHLDLTGTVVRAFANIMKDSEIIYGLEIDEDKKLKSFLETYVMSFSAERLKGAMIDLALKERYTKASDGFEMFSLLLALFKDISHFGEREGFLENMLEEVVRIMNACRASIFLINSQTNELEAVCALGVDKTNLKFDYRTRIAGSVFTTGVALNIDTHNDITRFNKFFDKKLEYETNSIICHPIHNREDKIVGVIEVINKRNEDRFSIEDEKTMKVLSLVFSSVFHNFNPMTENSMIRRFSTSFDRKLAFVGSSSHITHLRNTITKTKDIDSPILIRGEKGVGKSLLAQIIHNEGCRGLNHFEVVYCEEKDFEILDNKLFGPDERECVFSSCQAGTILLHEIAELTLKKQRQLIELIMKGGLDGSSINFDVRIIASTSKDLGALVDNGQFDRTLYHFLNKSIIMMEPLRRRPEDIEKLVNYFLKVGCSEQGLLLKSFSPKAMSILCSYDWPRNIEELKIAVERSITYNPKAHVITNIDLESKEVPIFDLEAKRRTFGEVPHVSDFNLPLKDRITLFERELILSEVQRHNNNKSKAAKTMGISREALRKKMISSEELIVRMNSKKAA